MPIQEAASRLIMAVPTVYQTKTEENPYNTEVRARDDVESVSIHYTVGEHTIPRVRDKVLCAILQGMPEEWLALPKELEECEAISVELPTRRVNEFPTSLKVLQSADGNYVILRTSCRDKEGEPFASYEVALDADQGVLFAAALLGILRRIL